MKRSLLVHPLGLACLVLVAGCSGSGVGDASARDAGEVSRAETGESPRADAERFRQDAEPPSRDTGLVPDPRSNDASETAPRPDADAVEVDAAFVVEPCTSLCNARTPSYPTIGPQGQGMGDITRYSSGPSKGGACNYGETKINYYVAVNVNVTSGDGRGQWQGGRACGQCVEIVVQTSRGPRTVVVRIVDRCADEYCGMDLGGDAPEQVMADSSGRYRGSWRFVTCDGHPEVSDGPPTFHILSGSNPDWAMVQVRNPPWPVASIDWQQQGSDAHGSFSYAGVGFENGFQVPLAVLKANAKIALTIRYTDGSSAQLTLASSELGKVNAYPLGS